MGAMKGKEKMLELVAVPLGRLELPFLAPEANALSTELQGRVGRFYHYIGKTQPTGCSAKGFR